MTLADIEKALAIHQIQLLISHKKVKNINFRVKPNTLCVSAPRGMDLLVLINAIDNRLDWAINAHQKVLQKAQNHIKNQDLQKNDQVALWGEHHTLKVLHTHQHPYYDLDTQHKQLMLYLNHDLINTEHIKTVILQVYRDELSKVMPDMFAKWQKKVGKCASETRIKKMSTRWGSCNTQAKRVWLSVYLPQYPKSCTEYVIVHELCHLYEANHSKKFWARVQQAMPDYQTWHQYLKGTGNHDI